MDAGGSQRATVGNMYRQRLFLPAAAWPGSMHAGNGMDQHCSPAPQAEAAAKAKAKEDLKAFLLSNEVNKKVPRGGEAGPASAHEAGRG